MSFFLLASVLLAVVAFTASPGQAQEPSLALAKAASPVPVAPGEQLTYTLIITNTGQAPLSNFAVRDRPPAGTRFASAGHLDGQWLQVEPVSGSKDEITWMARRPLPPGEAYHLLLVVNVEQETTGFVVNDKYAVLAMPEGSLLAQGPAVRTEVNIPAATPKTLPSVPTSTSSPTVTTLPSPVSATPTPGHSPTPPGRPTATVTPATSAGEGTGTSAWCPLAGVALVFGVGLWWFRGHNQERGSWPV